MDALLILGSLIAVYIIGVTVMRRDSQKHPNNGKDIERALSNHH